MASSARSPPAQNAGSSPVITIAPTPSSAAAAPHRVDELAGQLDVHRVAPLRVRQREHGDPVGDLGADGGGHAPHPARCPGAAVARGVRNTARWLLVHNRRGEKGRIGRAQASQRAEDGTAAGRDERAGAARRIDVRPRRPADRAGRGARAERLRLLQVRQAGAARDARPTGHRGRAPGDVPDRARAVAGRPPADAAALHQPDRCAERVRHRPQPAARRGLRHHRPARAAGRAGAAGGARPTSCRTSTTGTSSSPRWPARWPR